MNISIKLDLSVNGAVLVPTNEQFAKIKKAVHQIIFEGVEEVNLKTGRYVKEHKSPRWSIEEYNFMMTQFKQGHKFADIAHQLTIKFGNDRTKAAVQQRIYKFANKDMPKDILDKVMGSNVTVFQGVN